MVLPAAEVDEDTPFTGTLRFRCEARDHLRDVEIFLTARKTSALMGFRGERVYVKATAPIDLEQQFPTVVAIPIEIDDDPGPAIIGGYETAPDS